ELPLVKI
nr:Chain B, synthetic peptide ELPLVKI [synthetic construct]